MSEKNKTHRVHLVYNAHAQLSSTQTLQLCSKSKAYYSYDDDARAISTLTPPQCPASRRSRNAATAVWYVSRSASSGDSIPAEHALVSVPQAASVIPPGPTHSTLRLAAMPEASHPDANLASHPCASGWLNKTTHCNATLHRHTLMHACHVPACTCTCSIAVGR